MEPRQVTPEDAKLALLNSQFTAFYREHLRDVYSYAYYRIGNHHDAEDLTEQAFIQAYRHFERALAQAEGRPLRPWLMRITHNLAANYYRDRSRRPQTMQEPLTGLVGGSGTEERVLLREELAAVLKAFEGLEGERRDALIMRFALGMDNGEIAQALGRSAGATKVLLHRAIAQVRKEVDKDEHQR